MKFVSMLVMSLIMVGCGKSSDGPSKVPSPTKFTLSSVAGNDSRLDGVVLTLDMTKLNRTINVQELLGEEHCNGTSSNNTPEPIGENKVIITSTDGGKSGKIQFGNLLNKTSSNPLVQETVCRLFNRESYNFEFDGTTLDIYSIALGKAWDNTKNSFRVN